MHYNLIRFKEMLSVDEAEVLAGREDLVRLVEGIMYYMIQKS